MGSALQSVLEVISGRIFRESEVRIRYQKIRKACIREVEEKPCNPSLGLPRCALNFIGMALIQRRHQTALLSERPS